MRLIHCPQILVQWNITLDDWRSHTKDSSVVLKDWLLNQATWPSGIGNYLACEILAYSGLFPLIRLNDLTDQQWHRLYDGTQAVIQHVSTTLDMIGLWCLIGHIVKNVMVSCRKLRHKASAQTTHFCSSCRQSKLTF